MIVTLNPKLFDAFLPTLLAHKIPLEGNGYTWNDKVKTVDWKNDIELRTLTRAECKLLAKLLQDSGLAGSKVPAADIAKYLKASDEGILSIKARTVKQGAWMLEQYIAELPHHTLFAVDAYEGKSHTGYWATDVEYIPPEWRRGHDITPEYIRLTMVYIDDDIRHKDSWHFYGADVDGNNCIEILASKGLVPETEGLMEKLRAETERFLRIKDKVGSKYLAVGLGLMDRDDALTGDDGGVSRYWRRRDGFLKLDKLGATPVVIDVPHEGEKEDDSKSDRPAYIDPYRWSTRNMRYHSDSKKELERYIVDDVDTEEAADCDIPIHPLITCFDLRRGVRYRVHVNNLAKYEYNTKVAQHLILPDRDWQMVELLVDHSSNTFQDIVENKGRSMNVLSVGPPGTGKTATAEVFSEFKKRPLYTVQCSQLGIEADSVEKHLAVVMQRASRWNAVLLLDEADVYISKRGADLNQNAIVGAFLRVLEYSSCILFMTSNLPDQVDDAITSRCIARLTYGTPSREDQARIWRVLADINKLEVKDAEIKKITAAHSTLSGRDVKNLLKLASFVNPGKPITAEHVTYALQFKPTE